MEFIKINNLLGPAHGEVPRFSTKKWIEVQSQSGNIYNISKPIRFKTAMLRSDLCDYSDAYVWVKGKITVTNPNSNVNFDRKLTLKNNTAFVSCISKINGELVENAEDFDIAMPMYNLLEYSKNYEKTSGSLFNYYRDEPKEHTIGVGNYAVNISIRNSKSLDYKAKIVGSLADGELEKDDVKIAIPLKYLGNFWRSLDIPLINCEITLILSWYKKCVLVGKALRNAPDPQPNPPIAAIESPTDAKFEITDCKLYVPVVTLSAENDNKLFENEDDRTSYYKYYMPSVEIKDYNVLIDGNAFFELPVKNIEEIYEKITQITDRSGYYTRGNLLDYEYFREYYKLIAIDLSKQIELEIKDIKQQINFIGNLEHDDGAVMFFIIEKSEETILEFLQKYASIV